MAHYFFVGQSYDNAHIYGIIIN